MAVSGLWSGGHRPAKYRTRLGDAIRATGVPQYVIAAQAQIPPDVLSRYSSGSWLTIRPEHLVRLCRVLGRKPEELVGVVE